MRRVDDHCIPFLVDLLVMSEGNEAGLGNLE